ncbi:CYTH domain-containing protein [uncultured Tyzzerella sp.]|uniref:CYTH domain-containing protein n=1 Tax=uncultured Tyzzerella sp. TaxID=2321398 RepID=UPI002942F51A|nr:CYTH domain-containing protein [uncultured Tyzzerella sp.]
MKNIEIEKKFLVKYIPNLKDCKSSYIKQGYISTNPVLRIRQKDEKYIFTFKGKGDILRKEIEIDLSKEEFDNLWLKIEGEPIIKTRYFIPLKEGLIAELDIYDGNLKGFKNVEVEFDSIEEANSFVPPDWFGEDITKNIKYTNAYLSKISNSNIK